MSGKYLHSVHSVLLLHCDLCIPSGLNYFVTQVDLVEIKRAFLETYRKTLNKVVKGDTSGDYGKLLLAIIGDESVSIPEPPEQAPAAEVQPGSEEPSTQELAAGVGLCMYMYVANDTLPCITRLLTHDTIRGVYAVVVNVILLTASTCMYNVRVARSQIASSSICMC